MFLLKIYAIVINAHPCRYYNSKVKINYLLGVQGNGMYETAGSCVKQKALSQNNCIYSGERNLLEMDTTTFFNDGIYSFFNFFCPICCSNTNFDLRLQAKDNMGNKDSISISCCSVNTSSSRILSHENNIHVLSLLDLNNPQNSSREIVINGKYIQSMFNKILYSSPTLERLPYLLITEVFITAVSGEWNPLY